MGLDLASQINRQMRFMLPKVNETGGVARTLVVLFSEQAGEDKVRFEQALSSRSQDKNAVRVSFASELPQVLAALRQRGETILRFRDTPVVITYVAALREGVPELVGVERYPLQLIRLYQEEIQIPDDEPDTLFLRDNANGLDALVYLLYLQSSFLQVPAPIGGGVLSSWTARLSFDEWYRRLYCQLAADLRSATTDAELVKKQMTQQLEACCQAFVKKLKKPPSLSQYPVDGIGLEKIKKELPNALFKLFGKGKRLQLKKLLTTLYGRDENGSPLVLQSHKLFFKGQDTTKQFDGIWHSKTAWYYNLPLSQLEEYLLLILSERSAQAREAYDAKFSEISDVLLQGHVSVDGRKMQDILAAVEPWEKCSRKLYRLYAEAWFLKTALADAREGVLYRNMADAKKRILAQQQELLDRNAQTEPQESDHCMANWAQNIAGYAEQLCPPLEGNWTAAALAKAINAGCTLPCLAHGVDLKPSPHALSYPLADVVDACCNEEVAHSYKSASSARMAGHC